MPDGQPDPKDVANEMLIQLTHLAVSSADATGDERLKSIAALCMEQLQSGDTVALLLKMAASAGSGPTPQERRENERAQFQADWQESLRKRMMASQEQSAKSAELQEHLFELLLTRLADKSDPTKEATNDGGTISGTENAVDRTPDIVETSEPAPTP